MSIVSGQRQAGCWCLAPRAACEWEKSRNGPFWLCLLEVMLLLWAAADGVSLLCSFLPPVYLSAFLVQCVGVSGYKELSYVSWSLLIQISMFLAMNFQ